MSYELHLIASGAPPHDHPDATARMLSAHPTREEAHRAGRRFLGEHPGAWLQVQDADHREPGEDVAE